MPLRDTLPKAHLPRTHYFITIARGDRMRTLSVRTPVALIAAAVLALAALGGVAAALYLTFHDDLVAGLMQQQDELQYAYEGQLSDMRNRLDRAKSRQLLDETSLEGRLRTLFSRQAQLEARASMIETFAGETGFVRARSNEPEAPSGKAKPLPQDAGGEMSEVPAGEGSAIAVPSVVKPRPEVEDGVLGRTSDARGTSSRPVAAELSLAAAKLDRIEAEEIAAVSAIGRQAQERVAKFNTALATAGLTASRFAGSHSSAGAEGGPFVPLNLDPQNSAFDRAVLALRETLTEALRLQQILPTVPLRRPFTQAIAMTSPFGPRTDPFNGRLAMHTGVDFAMEMGAPVRATAAGVVAIAGPEGGYGNMVEVDHGHGLATRYAHLSAIAVAQGQRVVAGDVVGYVGATGRATGPHLHYETRIDGEPVDPVAFLKAGEQYFSAP